MNIIQRKFNTRAKEHKRAIRNGDIDKNETMNWEEREIINHEQNYASRKIKEPIHSVKDEHHINSISYSLPDIWIPCLSKKPNTQRTENAI